MKLNAVVRILRAHGVPYMVRDNRVLADSIIGNTILFEITEDITH